MDVSLFHDVTLVGSVRDFVYSFRFLACPPDFIEEEVGELTSALDNTCYRLNKTVRE